MMRVLAPAAAVVVLAAGGYGLSRIVGVQSTASSATAGSEAEPAVSALPSAQRAAAAAPASGTAAPVAAPSAAPIDKSAFTVISSGTNFLRATLRSQLETALGALAVEGPEASAPSSSPTQLQACVERLTSGLHPGTPKLVEHAHFQGQPAIVIVASSGTGYAAWVVAPGWVAPGCSATSAGVLDRTTF
jgi:hypothetical protein